MALSSKVKKIITMVFVVVAMTILLSGCSNTSNVLENGYYKGIIVKPNGEFIGVDKISDKKMADDRFVYKVEMNKDNKVEKISAMYGGKLVNANFYDILQNEHGLFSVISIDYQEGYIKYTFKDALMQPAKGFYGAYSVRFKLNDKNVPIMAYFYNKDGEQANNNVGFAQMLFTYDDKINLIKIGFADKNGERVATNEKQYEINLKYEDNRKHYPSEVSYRSKGGDLAVDARGVAKIKYTYDQKDKVTEMRFFGSDENLKEILGDKIDIKELKKGVGAIIKISRENNDVKWSFFGKDEQPLGIKALNNVSAIEYGYDEKGSLNSIKGYGTDGEVRAFDAREKNIVLEKYQYDEVGNLIQIAFYNKEGNLVSCNTEPKHAIEKLKYDEKRRIIEASYFGTNEEAIEIRYEYKTFHKKCMEYDDDGKVTSTKFYDKNDNEITTISTNNLINGVNKDSIIGEWDSGKGTNSLMLKLHIEGNQIIGTHYATWNNGAKLDGIRDKQTLSGVFTGKSVFTVNFKSDFGGSGIARINIIDGNTLEWKIISKNGDMYIPEFMKLTRKS